MDLAKVLATACVKAQEKQALEDPRKLRSSFESSVAKERAIRDYAKDLGGLADQRAEDEDQSLGGYANTAIKRMLPIPQTMGEAAIRLPAIAASGVGGYLAGHKLEEMDPLGLSKLKTVDQSSLHHTLNQAATDENNFLNKSLRNKLLADDPTLDVTNHQDRIAKHEIEVKESIRARQEALNEALKTKKLVSDTAMGEDLKFKGKKPVLGQLPPGGTKLERRMNLLPGAPDPMIWDTLSKMDETELMQALNSPGFEGIKHTMESHQAKKLNPIPDTIFKDLPEAEAAVARSKATMDKLTQAIRGMAAADPHDSVAAIQNKLPNGVSPKAKALRTMLAEAMGGEKHMPDVRTKILSAIEQGREKPGPIAELMPEVKPYRVLGTLGGLAAGTAATGIPMALRAMALKRQGGEAAVRARSKMQEAIARAQNESKQREQMLTGIGQ